MKFLLFFLLQYLLTLNYSNILCLKAGGEKWGEFYIFSITVKLDWVNSSIYLPPTITSPLLLGFFMSKGLACEQKQIVTKKVNSYPFLKIRENCKNDFFFLVATTFVVIPFSKKESIPKCSPQLKLKIFSVWWS